jgi:hypothetical protein
MNVQQAQRILSRHKEGDVYPKWVIDTALYLTGDIDEMPTMPSPHSSQEGADNESKLDIQKKSVF